MATQTRRAPADTDAHTAREGTRATKSTDRERTTSDAHVDDAARHAREVNEHILRLRRQAGNATLDAYERALETTSALTERVADASRVQWISTATQAQVGLARDLGRAYVSSARALLN